MVPLQVFVNVLLLFLLSVILFYLHKKFNSGSLCVRGAYGIIVGVFTYLSIIFHISVPNGYPITLITITVSLATLIFGPVTGLVSVAVTEGLILLFLKTNLLITQLILLLSFLMGFAAKIFKEKKKHKKNTLFHFYFFGLIIGLATSVLTFFFLTEKSLIPIVNMVIFYIGTLPLLFIVLGYFYLEDEERKKVLKKLFKIEGRYKLIADNISEVIALLDLELNIIFITPSIENVLGYSTKELVGKNISTLITDASLAEALQILNEELELYHEGKRGPREKRKIILEEIKKDGEHIFVENVASGVLDENGQPKYILVISRDVSDQLKLQNELRLSEEKFKKIFETIPDPVTITSIEDGIYVEVNKAFEVISGYQRNEILGHSAIDINIWENQQDRTNVLNTLKEKGEIKGIEAKFKLKDGSIVDALISGSFLEIDGKKHLLLISKVITDLKKAISDAKKSEANLTSLINNGDESIWSIDKGYNYIVFNKKFENDFWEYHRIKLEKGLNSLDILTIEEKIFWKSKYDDALSGKRIGFIYTKVVDGRTYYMNVFLSPIIEDKEINGVSAIALDITEKRINEITLEENEKRYKAMFELNRAPMIIIDGETGYIIDANDAAVDLYGYKKKMLLRKNIAEVNAKEGEEIFKEIKSTFSGKSVHNFVINTGKGLQKHVEVYSSPIEIKGKKYIYSIVNDVTEKIEADEKLRESEKRYRSIFEGSKAVFLLIDLETADIIDANESAVRFYGWGRKELLEKKISNINVLPAKDIEEKMKSASVKNKNFFFCTHRTANNVLKEVEVYATPISIDGRKVLFTLINDISEKRKNEEKLNEYRNLLELSQKIAGMGSWKLDVINGELYWSDEVYSIFGYKPQEFEPTYETFLEVVHPDDEALVKDAYNNSIKYNEDSYQIEHRIIRKDNGEVRNMFERCVHYRDEFGNITYSVGIVYDITERRKAETELKKLMGRLINSEEEMRGKISMELHDEVGQNLTALSINLNQLNMNVERGKSEKNYILQSIDGSLKILEQVSEKIRNVMVELRPTILDDFGLNAALNWALDKTKKTLNIDTVYEGNDLQFKFPKDVSYTVLRVVQEALHNIQKHANATKIYATLSEDENRVIIKIKDNGKGFNKEEVNKLKKEKGFGIVSMQERVNLIKGELKVISSPGEGTEVIIILNKSAYEN